MPAFLFSMFSCYTNLPNCFHLVSKNQDFCLLSALSLWTEKSHTTLFPPNQQRPKSWDLPLHNIRLTHLIKTSSSSLEKSHLLAVSAPHASHWLNALRILSLGLKMDNSSFKSACGVCFAILINTYVALRWIPTECMVSAVRRVLEGSPDIHRLKA